MQAQGFSVNWSSYYIIFPNLKILKRNIQVFISLCFKTFLYPILHIDFIFDSISKYQTAKALQACRGKVLQNPHQTKHNRIIVDLTHLHSEWPKEAWPFWKYLAYKSIFFKNIWRRNVDHKPNNNSPSNILWNFTLFPSYLQKYASSRRTL